MDIFHLIKIIVDRKEKLRLPPSLMLRGLRKAER